MCVVESVEWFGRYVDRDLTYGYILSSYDSISNRRKNILKKMAVFQRFLRKTAKFEI